MGSVPAIHSLDHFGLTVPDLELAERFYRAFGLDVRRERDGLGLYTFGHPHCWARITRGSTKRLHHLSFGVFASDWEAFKQHLEREKVPCFNPDSGGCWLHDPDGTLIELRVAPKSSPVEKSQAQFSSSLAGVAGAPKRSRAPRIHQSSLSHILLFTRDVPATLTFYSRILGLRLSDRSGDDIVFMHGAHGSDHHLVAFARSNAPGMHHSAHSGGLG